MLKIIILPQQRPIFSYIYHRLFFHYFLMEPLLRLFTTAVILCDFLGCRNRRLKGNREWELIAESEAGSW